MWKPEHRRAADRTDLRYPSDLSDGRSSLAAPRQRRDNTLRHVRRRLSQMAEAQHRSADKPEISDKFRATTSTGAEVGHQILPNRWPTL